MKSAAMDAFVARVREASDISGVVASYVPLKKKGGRYWGCCPFHQEKTPSFSVEPDKGFFFCFGCHAGGDVFKFISLIENVSYFDAIKIQAEKLGIPLPEREKSERELAREQKLADLRKMMAMARDFFHSCLVNTPYGAEGLRYFAGRGIGNDTIEGFGLGFAPDSFDKLRNAFAKRGVSDALLLAGGLVAERKNGNGVYDRFRNRVMIPIADERGRVVGFGGRVLDDSVPKYLNSPETVLFNKRKLLFGLDRAKKAMREAGAAILVEGYMDAISLAAAGIGNVAASLGTAFTVEQCRLLLRYAPEIYFCYDSDEAGQKATIRALSVVRETSARARVLIVPAGKDPDEFIRKHGAEAFRALMGGALSLADFQIRYALAHNDTNTLDGKSRALRAVLPVLKAAAVVEQGAYIQQLKSLLGIDEGIIRQELARFRGDITATELRPGREPIRRPVRETDDAVRRAGRLIIRMAWKDPGAAVPVVAMLGDESFPDEIQERIWRYLAALAEAGEKPDNAEAAYHLGEEAAAELSRALVEETAGDDLQESYDDCMRVLMRAHLASQFEKHRLRADAMEKEGNSNVLQELREIQRIKEEIDNLNNRMDD
ncbi:MAG: DNA primase [Schwartzia sp.]|nr:DNA primase [Schwartzia sp. (in: firmicutes)]